MFDPSQPPVAVTPQAWAQIEMLTRGHYALKLGLKKGGCAGMEYSMEIVEKADAHDIVIDGKNARLVVDAKAQMFLFGMEVDFETSLLESGFTFRNPNVTEACGCGESISFEVHHEN